MESIMNSQGFLFIGDARDNTVKRFNAETGEFSGTFVSTGRGHLKGPRGLVFNHDGNLLVTNQNVNTRVTRGRFFCHFFLFKILYYFFTFVHIHFIQEYNDCKISEDDKNAKSISH